MISNNTAIILCPICKQRIRPIKIAKLNSIIHKNNANILKCSLCDIAWTSPNPSINYETKFKYIAQILKSEHDYRSFALPIANIIEKLQTPPSRFLDIGCGLGYLVESVSQKGFDSEGIDKNTYAIEYARNRGLNVSTKSVDDLIKSNSQYDIISMIHVLEHIDNPISILKKIRELLATDGYLILSQTNYNGTFPKYFPQLWYGWQPIEHYWHFTPDSLKYVLNAAGFKTNDIIFSSLHHPFKLCINPKHVIGQNLISATAHFCNNIGTKDSFLLIAEAI